MLCDEYNIDKRHLYCVEIDPDLRYVLHSKGYKVVGSDFLEYAEPIRYDGIFANPPFEDQTAHILKMWEVLAPGGICLSLLNADSYEGSKLEEFITSLGEWAEFKRLGKLFKDAERPTRVEVGAVCFHKPKASNKDAFSFNGAESGFEMDEEFKDEDFEPAALATNNVIENLVIRYQNALDALLERHRQQKRFDYFMQGVACAVHGAVDRDANESIEQSIAIHEQIMALKSRFWNTVFYKTKLGSKSDVTFDRKLDDYIREQSRLDFTVNNIREMLSLLLLNQDQIMLDGLIEVFDKATAYHSKNKVHYEGWKTNKGWKLNHKIIHPYGIVFDDYGFRMDYGHREDFYNDLDKILLWINGGQFSHFTIGSGYITDTLRRHIDRIRNHEIAYDAKFKSGFFEIKIFKKGTVHLTFLDRKLCDEFNLRAAKGKNWIGGEGF